MTNYEYISTLSDDEIKEFLEDFRFDACPSCPLATFCEERIYLELSCGAVFVLWLMSERTEEEKTFTPMEKTDIESPLLDLYRAYNGRLDDVIGYIIERYERGCACVYCPKSAVPNRSPDKEVCTPADCARGLSEYIRRMEEW